MRRRSAMDPPEAFRRAVTSAQALADISREDLAGILGITPSALCKRLQDPGAMRVRDLAALLQALEGIDIRPVLQMLQLDRNIEIREDAQK